MKTISKFFLAVITMSVMVACSSDNDFFSDDDNVTPSSEGSSGSVDNASELISFTVAIDKTTAEPSSSASALYPEAGDAPSSQSFGTIVNINMSNPTDPGVSGVTVTLDGNNVVTDHGSTEGVCYVVTGSTSNGSLQINGSKNFKLQLNNATIANTSTVAIDLESKMSAYVELVGTNKVTDGAAADDSHKGAIYSKGKLFVCGTGSLEVYGTYANGIHGKSNVVVEKGVNLYVNSTAKHAIKAGADMFINGGIVNVETSGDAGKGINVDTDIYISGGRTTAITTGDGTWDEDDLDTKAAAGIASDNNFYLYDGEVYVWSKGSGGKGIKADNAAYIQGGKIRALTTGGLYYNNGTTENTNYRGNTDNLSSNVTSSPKGIKIGTKTEVNGVVTEVYGTLVISGGDIMVRTTGYNAEGIESKGTLDITGGQVLVYAYDDGINSTSDLTISNGTVMACSQSNDGIDSNGNMYIKGGTLIAVGANGAEAGIDTDESHALTITGGTVFGIGGRIDTKFSGCTQAFAVTSGSVAANAAISVASGSSTLKSFTAAPVSGNGTILVSVPGMTSGGSYTLKLGSSSKSISGVTSYNSGGRF